MIAALPPRPCPPHWRWTEFATTVLPGGLRVVTETMRRGAQCEHSAWGLVVGVWGYGRQPGTSRRGVAGASHFLEHCCSRERPPAAAYST